MAGWRISVLWDEYAYAHPFAKVSSTHLSLALVKKEEIMKKLTLAMVSIVSMTGCASTPPSFTPTVAQTVGRQSGTLGNVSVQSDPASLQNGQIKMIFGSEAIPILWKNATETAIAQSQVFDGKGTRKYDVIVTILMLKPPREGFTIKTPAKARYDVIEAETRKIVFTTEVETIGRVAFGDNFVGTIRIRDSINRATQSNIVEFLNRLQAARW